MIPTSTKHCLLGAVGTLTVFLLFLLWSAHHPSHSPYQDNVSVFPFSTLKYNMRLHPLFSQILLPTAIYTALLLIFKRYIPIQWSITFALLSILYINDYPFRAFLLNLISFHLPPYNPLHQPNIVQSINASFSILLFLTMFYITTSPNKYTLNRISILTCLWSLLSAINLINAVFGVIFWLSYLTIRLIRQNNLQFHQLLTTLSCQVLTVLSIILPFSLLHHTSLAENGIASTFYLSYFTLYLTLPLLTFYVTYKLYDADPFELLYKFLPVFVLMFSELILIIYSLIIGGSALAKTLESSIAFYFLHLYYYIPFLYYATNKPTKYLPGSQPTIKAHLISITNYIFMKISNTYLFITIFLLIVCFLKTTLQPNIFTF